MRNGAILIVVALLGYSPLMAQANSTAGRSGTVSAPALPKAVGNLRLSETSIFDDPMLGVNYRYSFGRSLHVDVAVQPARTLEGGAATADYIVNLAAQSFRTLSRTTPGGTQDFTIVRDTADTLLIGSRVVPGHIVAAQIRRGSSAERYHAWYIYVLGDRYIRVMVQNMGTGAAGPDSQAMREEIEQFVRLIVPSVASAWQS
jgi:hypothetical protein